MASLESEAARIFLEAVETQERGQWYEFVRAASAGDPVLLKRVNVLLMAHDKSNPMFDAERPLLYADIARPSEQPGTVIGPYKLIEQIGEGGMGIVFMAEQKQPVRRKVALKLIKPGMDSKRVIGRFEAERQALAMMDHPNIAKVLEAGTTEAGRPYFVMELIHGIPITEYCDRAKFTIRKRLELFVQVCRAVQHAHTKGIIHRDLKPGNVLVTSNDVDAVPKIIDFGVAKALDQSLTEQTFATGFAQMLGTPLYMSPEQTEFNQGGVDTRSDVYSLGVLLYELLTGTTPFESERLKQIGFDEMRRVIREEEPPRPSQRFSTLDAATRSTMSERRSIDAGAMNTSLHGELDWIVIKALEKDRNRRYESASAFAADVERYLKDEAVEACPPSAAYRLRKYVRRNRRALVTAGIVTVALVAATAVSTWQAVDANAAKRLADERLENEKKAREQAAVDSDVARAVNDFLQQDLLGQAANDPQARSAFNADLNLTVKETLDRAAARIGERFQGQPLVEAAIRTVIGQSYLRLSADRLALPHLERAIADNECSLQGTAATPAQWAARQRFQAAAAINRVDASIDRARWRLDAGGCRREDAGLRRLVAHVSNQPNRCRSCFVSSRITRRGLKRQLYAG